MTRTTRPIASDLFASGWLPPKSAAAALGITIDELETRARRGEIKRKQILPNSRLYLYEVD